MKKEVFKIKVNGKLKNIEFIWNCDQEDWDGVIYEIFNTFDYEYLGDIDTWKGGIDFNIEYYI